MPELSNYHPSTNGEQDMNSSMSFTIATVVALPMVNVAASRPKVFLQIAWIPAGVFIAMAGCCAWLYFTSLSAEAEMAMRDLIAPVPPEAGKFFEHAAKGAYEELGRLRGEYKQLGMLSAALLAALMIAVLAALIARRQAEGQQVDLSQKIVGQLGGANDPRASRNLAAKRPCRTMQHRGEILKAWAATRAAPQPRRVAAVNCNRTPADECDIGMKPEGLPKPGTDTSNN